MLNKDLIKLIILLYTPWTSPLGDLRDKEITTTKVNGMKKTQECSDDLSFTTYQTDIDHKSNAGWKKKSKCNKHS